MIASGLYTGLSPIAPGTVGSLGALIIVVIIPQPKDIGLSLLIVFFFIIGAIAASAMEKKFGKDPSIVTIDEFVGMWTSLLLLPKTFPIMLAAFFIFRIADILKPWPANWFDKKNGGLNIMMDDVIAGVYTNILLQLGIRIFS